MKISYREFDQHEEIDENIFKLFDFSDIIFREFEKDDPFTPRDLRLKAIRNRNPLQENHRIVAWHDGKIIASCVFGFPTKEDPGYETNKQMCGLQVSVLPEFRKKGIARNLLKLALEKIQENGLVKTIYTDSDNELGHGINKHFGGELTLESAENRLRYNEIDWEMVKKWSIEGKKKADELGIKLEQFQRCPEDIIEEYTQLYSETMMQQPLGGIDVDMKFTPKTRRQDEDRNEKLGLDWYTMITREKDGKISGLTEMLFHPQMPWKSFQNLTGVKDIYRGRGLGKWLKAEMLIFFNEKYKDLKYVSTGNADSNAPMLSINTRLGFKTHRKNATYKFELVDLLNKFAIPIIQ